MNPLIRKSLRTLGWGLVFPLVDFHLGVIDILPDFIGYIMILVALNRLESSVGGYTVAKSLAAVLIIFSLPQIVFKARININELTSVSLGMHVVSQGMIVLHGLLVYFIIRGLYKIAFPIASPELKHAIVSRIKAYMFLLAAQLIFYPFLLNFGEDLIIALLLTGVVMIIAEFLIVRIPFRMSRISSVPVEESTE